MKFTKIFTILTIAGATFASCNDGKKDNEEMTSEVEVEMAENKMDAEVNLNSEDNVVMTRTYSMKDGSKIAYNYDNDGVVSVMDWEDYNTVSLEMDRIETIDFNSEYTLNADLDARIANLGNTIPKWLKTEEVMEDVADIQKEYAEFTAEANASAKERAENFEELNEQFADLREELQETIDEYMKIYNEAVEEYNEEIRDDGDIDDAQEEYDEEIKKQDKIADYKEEKSK